MILPSERTLQTRLSRRFHAQLLLHLSECAAWPIINCISRLSEQKAQHYLVEAVALTFRTIFSLRPIE
jgi:hypothetical protein